MELIWRDWKEVLSTIIKGRLFLFGETNLFTTGNLRKIKCHKAARILTSVSCTLNTRFHKSYTPLIGMHGLAWLL